MAKRILVVDDDFEQRDLYLLLFSDSGYETTSAVDGLEGLEKALAQKPDLIFSGITMPRMDGYELIRNMRKNIATAKTPVILFSHLGREEDRQKASGLPYVTFMIKGMEGPPIVLKKVIELIGPPGPKSSRPNAEPIKISDAEIIPPKQVKTALQTNPTPTNRPTAKKNGNKNRDRAGTGTIIV